MLKKTNAKGVKQMSKDNTMRQQGDQDPIDVQLGKEITRLQKLNISYRAHRQPGW
jgi:hypothetical protein